VFRGIFSCTSPSERDQFPVCAACSHCQGANRAGAAILHFSIRSSTQLLQDVLRFHTFLLMRFDNRGSRRPKLGTWEAAWCSYAANVWARTILIGAYKPTPIEVPFSGSAASRAVGLSPETVPTSRQTGFSPVSNFQQVLPARRSEGRGGILLCHWRSGSVGHLFFHEPFGAGADPYRTGAAR